MSIFFRTLLCLIIYFNSAAQVNNTYKLMPVPSELKASGQPFLINQSFRVAITGNPDTRLYAESSRFIRRLAEQTGIFLDRQGFVNKNDSSNSSALLIHVARPGKLNLEEDESYHIAVQAHQVLIASETDLGAIRALETLLQLVSTSEGQYYFPGVLIDDHPRFAWRGLLLDVALHFMPVDVIKRTLDGMAAVKMNVLHLHLCNDQGFRVESKIFPQLNNLSSEGAFYTQENIKDIIRYANQRGIRIVPEFVVPAHTTAILVAFPELASVKRDYTIQRYFGVFDPVMDPTNPKVYQFLDKLFGEMAALFPDKYFHIGGDENTGNDWKNTPHIQAFMKEKGLKSYMDLQTEFNKQLLPIVQKYGKTMMGWDEILQPGVPKDIVIQSWRGQDAYYSSIKKGYRAILSYGYYIDLIQPTDYHYLNDPIPDSVQLTEAETKRVLGGEATMWSEHVTPETVDSRIWPRTAAIAERLWSAKKVNNVSDMYKRLANTSLHLEAVGLRHLAFKPVFLRRLANSDHTTALETLVNVIEPLKIYERNQGDTMYTVFSPYTKLADVATPDQPEPRIFAQTVQDFLVSNDPELEQNIIAHLTKWKNNHTDFLQTLRNSPVLEEAKILSENLSLLAQVGLEAMEFIHEKKQAEFGWLQRCNRVVANSKQQGGRCDLQVVHPIERLIKEAAGAGDKNLIMIRK